MWDSEPPMIYRWNYGDDKLVSAIGQEVVID